MIVRGSTLLETGYTRFRFVQLCIASQAHRLRMVPHAGFACLTPAVARRFQPVAAISLAMLGSGAFRVIR